ncbi:YhjD/YihY/BrkB family envelope integrity protein [Brevibacterium litoralis]|uniref:YhjD/YihY/BrkB family envelope integrity protein n=1 Tax=Brevibacterium litoralis TaxID=3138935 RepID=UPI0032ECD334
MAITENSQPGTMNTSPDHHRHRLLTDRTRAQSAGREFMHRPAVVHLKDTVERFNIRLGNQFAAAITYFLVLALIPTGMFAFASLGFFLDVLRPDLIDDALDIVGNLAPGEEIRAMIANWVENWAGVGIVSLLSAVYTAQGFIGNLKGAIRAQLRRELDLPVKDNIVAKYLNNLLTLLGLLIGIALTVVATVIGTGLQTQIVDWLMLPGWVTPVLTITPIFITIGAAWCLFYWIFTMIPAHRIPRRTRAIGSLIGAVALTALLNLATVLIGLFSGSPTAALFGPIIAVMAAMNIFARILLVIAAWMGTADDRSIFADLAPAPPGWHPSRTVTGPRADSTMEMLGGLAVGICLVGLTVIGVRNLGRRAAEAPSTPDTD